MTDDPDLRSRLERIASFAGDPSEHGLERVAARRHRRLRRRRGAVAAAAVLAVLAVGVPLVEQGLSDDRQSITASNTGQPSRTPPDLPTEVEVRCDPEGIVVPVASVRPQRDGLHIRVVNTLRAATRLVVKGDGWRSGDIEVPTGEFRVEQPVPPGEVTIGCQIGTDVQERLIELVDPVGYYVEPELACEASEVVELEDLPVDPPQDNIIRAARRALEPMLVGGTADDAISAPRGYPAQSVLAATDDPTVQLAREGEVIAFAHVIQDGGPDAPWVGVTAEVCGHVVEDEAADGTTTTDATDDAPDGTATDPGAADGAQTSGSPASR